MKLLSHRNPTRQTILIIVGVGIVFFFSLNVSKNSVFLQSPELSSPLTASLFLTNLTNSKVTVYVEQGAESDWRENVTIKELPYARARFDSRDIVRHVFSRNNHNIFHTIVLE
jgi:hypothetical protein